ncbi:hypothetical protein ACR2VE_27885, partial [Klebsiella pneumoniae]
VECRSVTITDEFRIARGYGSVWVVLLLGGDDACTHLVIRFCFRYSLNSAQRKEHWLTKRADSSRLSTQCSYLLCRYKKSRNRYAGSNYYLRTVSGLHFADLSACDGWSSRRYVEVTN